MTTFARIIGIAIAILGIGTACGDDSGPGDSSTADSSSDGEVMCIALGAECDGTVPCCAPNGCAGGMCGAPRPDGGGDAGDAATCADFSESCATLPCCEPTAQCVMPGLTCQPGMGGG